MRDTLCVHSCILNMTVQHNFKIIFENLTEKKLPWINKINLKYKLHCINSSYNNIHWTDALTEKVSFIIYTYKKQIMANLQGFVLSSLFCTVCESCKPCKNTVYYGGHYIHLSFYFFNLHILVGLGLCLLLMLFLRNLPPTFQCFMIQFITVCLEDRQPYKWKKKNCQGMNMVHWKNRRGIREGKKERRKGVYSFETVGAQ